MRRPNSTWLTDKKALLTSFETLKKNYRNRAAHTDELNKVDYENCKQLVFGDTGIMWELIISTQTIK